MAVVKIISEAAKEAAQVAARKVRVAKRKRANAARNKRAADKAKKTTVVPKPKTKSKTKPTGLTKASFIPVALRAGLKKNPALSKIAKGSAIAGLIGGGAGATLAINKIKKSKSAEAAKVTFGEAFKAARKKGEGTKFTYEGKSYTAVTKDDLKKKGYDANELKQYANRKGKARGPLRRAGQGIKKVLLGKDKKFGGDKGLIDFVRKPKKKVTPKVTPKKKMGGGMANASAPKKYKAGGMATKGLGKAYMKSKR